MNILLILGIIIGLGISGFIGLLVSLWPDPSSSKKYKINPYKNGFIVVAMNNDVREVLGRSSTGRTYWWSDNYLNEATIYPDRESAEADYNETVGNTDEARDALKL